MNILQLFLCLCIIFTGVNSSAYYYTGHGGFDGLCPLACKEGYTKDSSGSCQPKVYVVQFQVEVKTPPDDPFNIRKYIESIAFLAGVEGCGETTMVQSNQYETACTTPKSVIRATVQSSSSRRLFAVTANVVTEIRIESDQTKAQTVMGSVTVQNINTELQRYSVGSATMIQEASLSEQVVQVTRAPSTRPPSTQPPSTRPPATQPVATQPPVPTPRPPSPATTVKPTPAPPPQPPSTTAAPPPPTTETSSNNTGLIIGVVSGVLVGLLVIGVMVAMFFFPGKKTAPPPIKIFATRFNMRIPVNATLMYAPAQNLYPTYPLHQVRVQREF